MSQNWPTRDKDLQAARVIMEEYASERESDTLGLFEIVVDQAEKKIEFPFIWMGCHFSKTF